MDIKQQQRCNAAVQKGNSLIVLSPYLLIEQVHMTSSYISDGDSRYNNIPLNIWELWVKISCWAEVQSHELDRSLYVKNFLQIRIP